MTVELQRAEEVIDQSRRHSGYARIGQALPALQDKSRQRIPGWVLGRALMSTVPLGPEGLWQTFHADRSHLRRIELVFAPIRSPHLGSIRISLHRGGGAGELVAERIVSAAELRSATSICLRFSATNGIVSASVYLGRRAVGRCRHARLRHVAILGAEAWGCPAAARQPAGAADNWPCRLSMVNLHQSF